jgi:hypothetical protein
VTHRATAVAHRRPGALGSANEQDTSGESDTRVKRKPFGAVISIRSHDYHVTLARASGGGFLDASLPLPVVRVYHITAQGTCSLHCMLAGSPQSAGRGRSELASRLSSSGRGLTIRMRKVGWGCLRTRQAPTVHKARAVPGYYRMEPSRSRHETPSNQITGLARWNAKERSDLHSRTQPHMRCEGILNRTRPAQNRAESTRFVGMASFALHRPSAWIAASRSANFPLLACDRRSRPKVAQYAIPAKICAIF